jgi:diguanylate cyclase (GGDEF)-like protein
MKTVRKNKTYSAKKTDMRQKVSLDHDSNFETKGKVSFLETIADVSRAAATYQDSVKLFDEIYNQIIKHIKPRNMLLAMAEPERNIFRVIFEYRKGQKTKSENFPLGQGLATYVWEKRESILTQDYKAECRKRKIATTAPLTKAWLGVPLMAGNTCLGILMIWDDREDVDISEETLTLAEVLANQAAATIYNFRMREDSQQSIKEISTLYQVTNAAVSEQNLDQVLKTILGIISNSLGYPNCAILLTDEKDEFLYIKAAVGYPKEQMGMRIRIGKEGICGWVAAKGKTLYVKDVTKDKRYLEGVPGCGSEVAIPLWHKGRVIGILDVESPEVNAFAEKDVRLLENFAGQAALTINKIRLEELAERRIKELSDINEISQSLSVSSDLGTITGRIIERIADALSVKKCMLSLYNNETDEIEVQLPVYYSDQLSESQIEKYGDLENLASQFRFKLSQGGIASAVFEKGLSYYSNDVMTDPYILQNFAKIFEIEKILVIPLSTRNRIIGLIYAADKVDGGDFTERDLRAGEALSSQAALVLDNARLYGDMVEGLKQLSILYQFSQAITSFTDVNEILRVGLDTVSQVVISDTVSVMLLDIRDQKLRIKASRGLSHATVDKASFSVGQGLAGWVAEKKQPVLTDDLRTDKRFKLTGQEEELASSISVPLMAKNQVIGVLNINNFSNNYRHFLRKDMELALTLGNSIAMAIERADLVSALDNRISAHKALLDTSSMLLGALEVNQVLEQIAQQIEQLIPFQRLAIYKADWEKRQLYPILARGPNTEEIMADPPFSVDTGITGAIAQSGKAELINNTDLDKRTTVVPGTTAEAEALLVLPLVVQDRSEAVLVIGQDVSRGFSVREFELASLFANQAAVAWKNAALFSEIKNSENKLADTNSRLNLALKRQIEVNTELSTLQYLSSTILSSLKLEEILSVIVEGIRSSLGFEAVLISLVEGGEQVLTHKAASGIPPEEFESLKQAHPNLEQYTNLMRAEYRIGNSYFLPFGKENGDRNSILAELENKSQNWQPGNLLIVPLYSKEKKLLAMIQIDKPVDGKIPDKRKVRSLEAFANTAALAIANATLYNEAQSRITELSTLYNIGIVISSAIEREKLLERVVEVIRDTLHYLKVAIFTVEPQSKSIFIGAQCGYGEELNMLYFTVGGNSVVGWVAEHGEPQIINDIRKDQRYSAIDPRVLSEIAVPIKREGKTIGVLNIEDDKTDAFSDSDLRLLTTLASQVAVALDNARLYEEAKRRINELSALHNVGTTVSSTLRLDALLDQVCRILSDTFHYNKIAIMIVDRGANELVFKASLGYQNIVGEMGRRLKIGKEGITGMVAATGEPIMVKDVTQNQHYVSIDGKTRSELAVPLKIKQQVVGVLNVESDNVNAFDQVDQRLLTTLASQVAVALENARLYEETEMLAVTDGLTGLNNHRYFQSFFERELNRARRYNHPLSLIMVDIDHFKKINDTLGHPIGDRVLQVVARLLREQARDVDLVARYGGEEFMLVLPETKRAEAQMLAERIRKTIERNNFGDDITKGVGQVTISLGVSGFPEDGSEKNEIIDKVDKALYRAKAGGRNQVRI